ncbi:phosphoglucosamine mutase [Candidatus Halobonum tyrrellensis]|uniref:Phosphoglucosamine mutase n=1 Tax=Candidatus Halobonum tyrrellensis G22 TaxID=1324957 RepID=V4IX37_9EURY|nr:phosphoglucosamine mutase [Candidatus Halobonum tyrrellensis]ESP87742.1 phosphoglucosamine mutase [Candidatus Halobonum tyrrellensis G22]
MKVFGSSGTRGVVGEGFTPEFVLRVAKAAASVWDDDRVALGRDTRTTGPMLADAAAAGLASVGVDVDRLGVAPTPATVRYCGVEGVPGIQITASHNPREYNGIKLVGNDGVELPVSALERVEEALLAERFTDADWETVGGTRRVETANDDYVAEMLATVDRNAIADAGLTVALDPGHGAGAVTSPEFFRELGCEVVTVNAQPDGHFPGRDPEPLEANLADLGRLVESTDADVGIAHDGDADRAIFYDETGAYVQGDASLAALAAESLSAGDTTVAAVNVSQRLVDVCEDVGATLDLTPIGSTNIITRIRELTADGETVPVAGEGNGGVFFPDYRLTRDGAFIGAKFLELLASRGETASEAVEPYSDYYNVRRDLTYDEDAELDAMLAAAEAFAADADAEPNTIDGYRLDYGDAWVLVRSSGTEPKVRVYAEARDADRAEALAAEVYDALVDAR